MLQPSQIALTKIAKKVEFRSTVPAPANKTCALRIRHTGNAPVRPIPESLRIAEDRAAMRLGPRCCGAHSAAGPHGLRHPEKTSPHRMTCVFRTSAKAFEKGRNGNDRERRRCTARKTPGRSYCGVPAIHAKPDRSHLRRRLSADLHSNIGRPGQPPRHGRFPGTFRRDGRHEEQGGSAIYPSRFDRGKTGIVRNHCKLRIHRPVPGIAGALPAIRRLCRPAAERTRTKLATAPTPATNSEKVRIRQPRKHSAARSRFPVPAVPERSGPHGLSDLSIRRCRRVCETNNSRNTPLHDNFFPKKRRNYYNS